MNRRHYSLLVGCLLGVLAQPARAQEAQKEPPSSAAVSTGKDIGKAELTTKKGQDAPTPNPKEKAKGVNNLNSSKSNAN